MSILGFIKIPCIKEGYVVNKQKKPSGAYFVLHLQWMWHEDKAWYILKP